MIRSFNNMSRRHHAASGTAVFEISDSGTDTNQILAVTMKPSLVKDEHLISASSERGIGLASNTFSAGPQSNNPSSTPYGPAVDIDKTANTDLPQGSGDTGVRGKGSLAVIGIALFGLVLATLLRSRSKS